MQELKDIFDFLNQMDYETLFKNLKAINNKDLQEKLRKEININFKTNADLSYEELRLYGYRKLTKPEVFLQIKNALEKFCKSKELRFYIYKENKQICLNDLDVSKSFFAWYVENTKPQIYFEYKNKEYNLKIYDVYFYDVLLGNKTILELEANRVFGKKMSECLYELSQKIKERLDNEFYK